jgi:hypothetical protein
MVSCHKESSRSCLPVITVELRDAIRDEIPSMNQLLKHDASFVRSTTASTLAKLADYGECSRKHVAAQLTSGQSGTWRFDSHLHSGTRGPT